MPSALAEVDGDEVEDEVVTGVVIASVPIVQGTVVVPALPPLY